MMCCQDEVDQAIFAFPPGLKKSLFICSQHISSWFTCFDLIRSRSFSVCRLVVASCYAYFDICLTKMSLFSNTVNQKMLCTWYKSTDKNVHSHTRFPFGALFSDANVSVKWIALNALESLRSARVKNKTAQHNFDNAHTITIAHTNTDTVWCTKHLFIT